MEIDQFIALAVPAVTAASGILSVWFGKNHSIDKEHKLLSIMQQRIEIEKHIHNFMSTSNFNSEVAKTYNMIPSSLVTPNKGNEDVTFGDFMASLFVLSFIPVCISYFFLSDDMNKLAVTMLTSLIISIIIAALLCKFIKTDNTRLIISFIINFIITAMSFFLAFFVFDALGLSGFSSGVS